MTSPEPDAILESFYRRVRPGGRGWRRIAEKAGFGAEGIEGGALAWTNWIAGIVAVYSTLFGIGKIIFGETRDGDHAARHRRGGICLDRAVVQRRGIERCSAETDRSALSREPGVPRRS